MTKTILATALILAATAASATELTAVGGRNYGTETNNAGVVVGETFGPLKGEASVTRDVTGTHRVTNYGVAVGYPVAKLGSTVVTAKAGVNYLDATKGLNGYGAKVALEAAYPLTKHVSVVGEYGYLRTESQIRALGGNQVAVGVRYGF